VSFNRGNFFSALAGGLIAVMLLGALPAVAGTGDNLVLGSKNTSRRVTKVTTKNGFLFRSTKVGVPAATFESVAGPPIAVNSNWWVEHLNADYVDGWSSYELRSDWGWYTNDSIADNVDLSAGLMVQIPFGGGGILMSGSVDFLNNTANADWIRCYFTVNGSVIAGSDMEVWAQPGQYATCSTDTAFQGPAGTYNVKFETFGMWLGGLEADDGSWYYIVLPN